MSRRREAARQSRTMAERITAARRRWKIHPERWRDSLVAVHLHNDLRPALNAYVDAHGSALGADWVAAMILFFDADERAPSRQEQIYAYLIARWPPCAAVEGARGTVLALDRGELHAGRRHLERAVALWPDGALLWYHLGLVWQVLGIYTKAARCWETAASCPISSPSGKEAAARAAYNRGALCVNLHGDRDAALVYLDQALRLMPEYPAARQVRVDLEQQGLAARLLLPVGRPARIP